MRGRIERLEVFNFKSYKGHEIIGPFRNFTAVIGPNGAGKSNLMDAISFVLGVRAHDLRGNKLKDLIYRVEGENGSFSSQNPREAWVMLVFVTVEEEEVFFKRAITPQGTSEYSINDRSVTWEVYNKRLISYNILVKARNFLVFQGDVESIAAKSPKELTALIEKISGSDELQKEYDRLAEAKKLAEDNVIFSLQKKKGVSAEKKLFKEQKKEAEMFTQLLQRQASAIL
ncbi:SMC hinge domain-containing protein [Balamuthia mandrillaris]